MKKRSQRWFFPHIILVGIFLGIFTFLLLSGEWGGYEIHGAGTNIDGTYHWAWNDLIGWIDFNALPNNVVVNNTTLTGEASSSVGSIYLDCASSPIGCGISYGVVNNSVGQLSGFAWNDGIGWISFCGGQNTANCPGAVYNYQVTINGSSGDFSGYAWNDTVGWISFNCINTAGCGTSDYKVKTNWLSTSSVGWLESATYDTGVSGGAQINSILWRGYRPTPTGTSVRFQLAFSNSANGPWNYGWDSTKSYSDPIDSGQPIQVDYTLGGNQRYFRYRIYLYSDNLHTATPRVDDVVVNWSR